MLIQRILLVTLISVWSCSIVVAMDVEKVPCGAETTPALHRAQSLPVIKLLQTPSISDLRMYKNQEQQRVLREQTERESAERHAREEQLKKDRRFHEATGLGCGNNCLQSTSEFGVSSEFEEAKMLLKRGAKMQWGHPLLNLLTTFKLRQEGSYGTEIFADGRRNTYFSGYHQVHNPELFGAGHDFFAWLIDQGADVNDVWPTHDTERFRHKESWGESKTDVKGKTSNTHTPLTYALELCKQGCCVRKLLEKGAHVYAGALMNAFEHKNAGIALTLIEHGAAVDETDREGNNAVHKAVCADFKAAKDRVALLESLYQKGAALCALNNRKETPLHNAVVEHTNILLRDDVTSLEWLLAHNPAVDAQDKDAKTALYLAIAVESSFYRNCWSENCCGYLHNDIRPKQEVQKLLWEKYAPKELFAQNTCMADILLKAGANPALAAKGGVTPLHKAAERGMQDGVALLIDHRAPVNAKTDTGLTPLHCVILSNIPLAIKTVIVEQLMDAGAAIDRGDQEGNTPLHKAAQAGLYDEVALLLAFGAPFDGRNLRNESALELFRNSNRYYFVKAKVEKLFKRYKEGKRVPHFDSMQRVDLISTDIVSSSE